MLPVPVDVLDGSLDYAALGVSALTAMATLIALGVAIWTATDARAQAAEDRASRDHAIRRQQQIEMEASKTIADAHRDIERDRVRRESIAQAQRKASEQARYVDALAAWAPTPDGEPIPVPEFELLDFTVTNRSKAAITDVSVWFDRASGMTNRDGYDNGLPVHVGEHARIDSQDSGHLSGRFYVTPLPYGAPLPFIVEFTDALHDRWRIDADRTLTLLNPRRVEIDDTGAYAHDPFDPPPPAALTDRR